jgi:hypothetical protein
MNLGCCADLYISENNKLRLGRLLLYFSRWNWIVMAGNDDKLPEKLNRVICFSEIGTFFVDSENNYFCDNNRKHSSAFVKYH